MHCLYVIGRECLALTKEKVKRQWLDVNNEKTKRLWLDIKKARYLYLFLLPLMLWLIIFQYGPMYGLLMAFKDYKVRLGILGSDWVGLEHFRKIFITPVAIDAILNTFKVSVGRLIWEFPLGIILAIMLTEMPGKKVKKAYQTIFTFPHFLSWVIVANILRHVLGNSGMVNEMLAFFGLERVDFVGRDSLFHTILYITSNWKEVGWNAIIYMAAIAGIDTTLYDAAEIDGASRFKRIWYITLPGIRTTIAVMLILAVGGIMNAGMDQIFNMRNPLVENSARILDIYVYDLTFNSVPNHGFSTAVGLFKSLINLFLLLFANWVVFKITDEKMFS